MLNDCIARCDKEDNKNFYEIYKNQFLNYIYHIEKVEDIDLILNFIKM